MLVEYVWNPRIGQNGRQIFFPLGQDQLRELMTEARGGTRDFGVHNWRPLPPLKAELRQRPSHGKTFCPISESMVAVSTSASELICSSAPASVQVRPLE